MNNKTLVTGWQPISEYNSNLRPWVLVKCYDQKHGLYYTDYAVLLSNNKWYTTESELELEPNYFFDVDQVPFEF